MVHLGIDFGTANTRISVYDGSRLPEPLPIGKSGTASAYMMPSACWVDEQSDIIVGEHALAQPARLKFIKRYWQERPEDGKKNPWRNGQKEIAGRLFTCEEMVEHVIGEALSRTFERLGADAVRSGFTANIICPVDFDRARRLKLAEILARRGARAITLNNVIDEPLAAAVLYGRLETVPPTKLDILIFDAGAGTVDAAVVRYQEDQQGKRITVLAEQGRCSAGSDLDRAMEELIAEKLTALAGVTSREAIFDAYNPRDREAGQVAFEEECEQIKVALASIELFQFRKADFLNRPEIKFDISRAEFGQKARGVLMCMEGLVYSVLREAQFFVQDFEGVHLLLLIGGTSKFPLVADLVRRHCPSAKPVSNTRFDEMLSTVRGVGFTKDFRDLVLKRPPYTTELRVRLVDGSSHPVNVNEAFQPFDWRLSYSTSLPYHEVRREFRVPIDSVEVSFISPNEQFLTASDADLRDAFRGAQNISGKLDIRGRLRVYSGHRSIEIQAPYFSQVGLRPPRPYDRRRLNAPEVYPDDN